jgi:hypothetical protein
MGNKKNRKFVGLAFAHAAHYLSGCTQLNFRDKLLVRCRGTIFFFFFRGSILYFVFLGVELQLRCV